MLGQAGPVSLSWESLCGHQRPVLFSPQPPASVLDGSWREMHCQP